MDRIGGVARSFHGLGDASNLAEDPAIQNKNERSRTRRVLGFTAISGLRELDGGLSARPAAANGPAALMRSDGCAYNLA